MTNVHLMTTLLPPLYIKFLLLVFISAVSNGPQFVIGECTLATQKVESLRHPIVTETCHWKL